MSHVFISYSTTDRTFVEQLRADLRARDISIWIDHQDLVPGTHNWEIAIRNAIEKSGAVLYIASPTALRSEYVQGELAIARMHNRLIYPVWAQGQQWINCVPIDMSKIQHIDARHDYESALPRIVEALGGTGIEPIKPPPVPELPLDFTPRNPYKGLKAFRKEDAGDFFGRAGLIDDLIGALGDGRTVPRLLGVLGASGSGKSSVMMAGVLPKLQAGAIDGSESWTYLDPMVPGTQPLEKLTIMLSRHLNKAHTEIQKDLRDESTRGLHRLASEISDKPVILYIDQFEELFTLVDDETERQQVIDLLTTAVTEPDGVLNLLLSLRADFYDRPAGYREFGLLLKNNHALMTPMTLSELYEAVQKPAEQDDARLAFDDGLVNDIVFAVREDSAALPLLQFTLDQLFQQRDGNRLTHAAYHGMGGVQGALVQHAEATYNALSEAQQPMARALFLRLIEPGATEQDTTRRRASDTELTLTDSEQTRILRETAAAFIKARLLVADEDTLEVSHEALIREWERLRTWLHTAREDVLLQKKISADVAGWQHREQPDEMLYRGRVLREAQDWAATNLPSADEVAFLETSAVFEAEQIAAEERRKEELKLAGIYAEEATAEAKRASAQANVSADRAYYAIAGAAVMIGVAIVVGIVAASLLTTQFSAANTAQSQADIARTQVGATQTQVAVVQTGQAPITNLQATQTQVAVVQTGQAEVADIQATQAQVITVGREFVLLETRAAQWSAWASKLDLETRLQFVEDGAPTGVMSNSEWTPQFETFGGVEMVLVPPGCFMMDSETGEEDEDPTHEICFDEPFWLDRYEVTNAQFAAFDGQAGLGSSRRDGNHPREQITWFEARNFCASRNARLPTEAEWEYAARGPDARVYPWGNEWNPDNANWADTEPDETFAVGSFPAGESWVGAYDLSGNVWEWVNTILDNDEFPYPYATDDGREDVNRTDARRVLRGGSWLNNTNNLRAATRFGYTPDNSNLGFGFRCARS